MSGRCAGITRDHVQRPAPWPHGGRHGGGEAVHGNVHRRGGRGEPFGGAGRGIFWKRPAGERACSPPASGHGAQGQSRRSQEIEALLRRGGEGPRQRQQDMAAILRSKEVAARVTEGSLDVLLATLITDRIVYFPIRHHSPACARHLERIIRERKPQAILIEGPASFTSLIPLVLHPKTKTPFAIYTSFVREQPEPEAGSPAAKTATMLGPPRHAAYYPFCDYSPELVALRVGTEVGASLRFIDLDYSDQIRAERKAVKP